MRRFLKSVTGAFRRLNKPLTIVSRSGGSTIGALNIIGTSATGAGQNVLLYRNTTPVAGDIAGNIKFSANNALGTKVTFAELVAVADDITNGSEDGSLQVKTTQAGSSGVRLTIGAGVLVGNATGGVPAEGVINASNYLINGSELPVKSQFVSSNQTMTAGSLITVAHGLAGVPRLIFLQLYCNTAEFGWSIGDVMYIDRSIAAVYSDATNVYVRMLSVAFSIVNKTTGAGATATNANWRMIVRAYY